MKCVGRVGIGAHISDRPTSRFTFLEGDVETVIVAATESFETGKTYTQEDLDKAEIKPVVKAPAPETEPEGKPE